MLFLLLTTSSKGQDKIKLSLQDCINIVKNNNYIIKNSKIEIEISEEKIKEAKNSWIPNINAYLNNYYKVYAHNHDLDEIYFHSDSNVGEVEHEHKHEEHFNKLYSEYNNEFGIDVNILLYNYDLNKLKKEKSRFDYDSSIYRSLDAENRVLINLNELYFDAVLKNEVLKISENNVQNVIDLLNITDKKYKVGVITKFELNQVKQEYNSSLFDLVEKKIELKRSIFKLLNFLQFKDQTKEVELMEDLSDIHFDNILYTEGEIKKELSEYPSVLAERSVLYSIQKQTNILENEFKPKVFGIYSIGSNYIGSLNSLLKSDPLFTQWKNNFINRIGLGISIPILNEYSKKSSIVQSNLDAKIQENIILNTENNLHNVIVNEILVYNNGIELISISQGKVSISQEVYDMSLIAYNSGVINLYDLNKSRYDNITNKIEMTNLKIMNYLKSKIIEIYLKRK